MQATLSSGLFGEITTRVSLSINTGIVGGKSAKNSLWITGIFTHCSGWSGWNDGDSKSPTIANQNPRVTPVFHKWVGWVKTTFHPFTRCVGELGEGSIGTRPPRPVRPRLTVLTHCATESQSGPNGSRR